MAHRRRRRLGRHQPPAAVDHRPAPARPARPPPAHHQERGHRRPHRRHPRGSRPPPHPARPDHRTTRSARAGAGEPCAARSSAEQPARQRRAPRRHHRHHPPDHFRPPRGPGVEDDGPGIPPEHREAVFARFTRLDRNRGRDTGGTGLGLSIARRIATTHAGTLRATDRSGEHTGGARLMATLPLSHSTGPDDRP
ncbi:ATP-binding protein [Umezawaea sp. Da 62-37]|uniref:ATP-binding protein n=1 Tax=Umezawaea sp. Da 62-37 TaxID=3075927 RepID=UPI0037DC8EBE